MTEEALKTIICKLVSDKSLNDNDVNVIDGIVEKKDYGIFQKFVLTSFSTATLLPNTSSLDKFKKNR